MAPLLITTTAGGIFTTTEYKIFYLHVIKYIKNTFHIPSPEILFLHHQELNVYSQLNLSFNLPHYSFEILYISLSCIFFTQALTSSAKPNLIAVSCSNTPESILFFCMVLRGALLNRKAFLISSSLILVILYHRVWLYKVWGPPLLWHPLGAEAPVGRCSMQNKRAFNRNNLKQLKICAGQNSRYAYRIRLQNPLLNWSLLCASLRCGLLLRNVFLS